MFETVEPWSKRHGLDCSIERRAPYNCFTGNCAAQDCPGYPQGDGRSHGIGTAQYWMIARGEGIAVSFSWFSGEFPDGVSPETKGTLTFPMAVDLGYHTATPLYEGQTVYDENCIYLGLPCHYDGSGIAAMPVLEMMQESGQDAVWAHLADYHRSIMNDVIAFQKGDTDSANREPGFGELMNTLITRLGPDEG